MYKVKILLSVLVFVCCTPTHNINLNGHWRIHHVMVNDQDILGNEIEHENMFNQGFTKSKLLKIKNDSLYFFNNIHHKSEKGKISFPKKNIAIIDSQIEFLNGTYNLKLDTLKTIVGGINSLDVRVTLTSNEKVIYINKVEAAK